MSDRARKQNTDNIIDAKSLKKSKTELEGPWECPACKVEMVAVACSNENYKVSPHFRANGKHEENCDLDGKRVLVEERNVRKTTKRMGTPTPMPSVLRIIEKRPQRASQQESGKIEGRIDSYTGAKPNSHTNGSHESSASTIQRIVEAHLSHPSEQDHPLRIPGCDGRTYGTCFHKLKNIPRYTKFKLRIMSAPIRFTDLRYHENEMVVYLNRGILPYFLDDRGKWKLSGYYRIHFLTDEWTERKRELFRNELLEAVRRQKEYYRGDRKREVFVFFLGEQQADDLASFLVDKYQLACFIDLHRITDNAGGPGHI